MRRIWPIVIFVGIASVFAIHAVAADPAPGSPSAVNDAAKEKAAAKPHAGGTQTYTNVVIDAAGQPIVGGTLEITFKNDVVRLTPDARGEVTIAVPPGLNSSVMPARFSHPDYGRAEGSIEPRASKECSVPLVKRGDPAYERALKGTVVDPENKPIADAVVYCDAVRSARGDYLVFSGCRMFAHADDRGRFAVYPVAHPNSDIRPPALLPAGAKFMLRIETTDETLLPYSGEHPNTATVTVQVQRPTRFYKLKFEKPGGGFVEDSKQLQDTTISYTKTQRDQTTSLSNRIILNGGKLPPGIYRAHRNGASYLDVVVTSESPDELVFRLKPVVDKNVSYHGHVVDGITGKPVPHAIVFTYEWLHSNSFARLTAEDWKSLRELPVKDMGSSVLRKLPYVKSVTRADEEGRYEIAQTGTSAVNQVVAVDENRIPSVALIDRSRIGKKTRVDVQDLSLFPAARVVVKVACPTSVMVLPTLHATEEKQPEWFGIYGSLNQLPIDLPHPFSTSKGPDTFYVPAGVALSVELISQSHEEWSSARLPKPIRLANGETLDLGTIDLPAALNVKVSIVDPKGGAVEGARVARVYKQGPERKTRTSDSAGHAAFYLNHRSSGRFEVILPASKSVSSPPNPYLKFEVGEQAPSEVYKIELTDAQFQTLTTKAGKE